MKAANEISYPYFDINDGNSLSLQITAMTNSPNAEKRFPI